MEKGLKITETDVDITRNMFMFRGEVSIEQLRGVHAEDLPYLIAEKVADKFIEERGPEILEKIPVEAVAKAAVAKVALKLAGIE